MSRKIDCYQGATGTVVCDYCGSRREAALKCPGCGADLPDNIVSPFIIYKFSTENYNRHLVVDPAAAADDDLVTSHVIDKVNADSARLEWLIESAVMIAVSVASLYLYVVAIINFF